MPGIIKKIAICATLMLAVDFVGGSTETVVFTGWSALAALLLRRLW